MMTMSETDGRGYCTCRMGHTDQLKRYPLGVRVVVTDTIPQVGESAIPVGTSGKVTDHCDDGRAWFVFDYEPQQGHTFHFPEQWLTVVASYNTNPEARIETMVHELAYERVKESYLFNSGMLTNAEIDAKADELAVWIASLVDDWITNEVNAATARNT